MKQKTIVKGHSIFKDGKFFDDDGMQLIEKKLKEMYLLFDEGSCEYGFFYFDPKDNSFWHYIQYEDYSAELGPVTREFIEKNFPSVDCDKLLDVER